MPGRLEVELGHGDPADRPHPAVGVGDADAVEDVEDEGQHRVADPSVRPGHRPRWILPLNREPTTRSAPRSSSSTNAGARERYVPSASAMTMYSPRRLGKAAEVGAAVAAPGSWTTRAPPPRRARPTGRSTRCRRRAPRRFGRSARCRPRPSPTTSATPASSFRHGMTTDTATRSSSYTAVTLTEGTEDSVRRAVVRSGRCSSRS